MSFMFNEICINEEMLPKYTYIILWMSQVGFAIDDLKFCRRIFVVSEYHNCTPQLFVADEKVLCFNIPSY